MLQMQIPLIAARLTIWDSDKPVNGSFESILHVSSPKYADTGAYHCRYKTATTVDPSSSVYVYVNGAFHILILTLIII